MTLTQGPEMTEARSVADSRRRMWPWVAAAILVLVLMLTGATWWLLDSTVPVADYNELVAELGATEEALETTADTLATVEGEVAGLQSEVESLAEANGRIAQDLADEQSRTAAVLDNAAGIRVAVASAIAAARAQATDIVNFDPDFAAEVQEAGSNLTLADDVLTDLGRDETFVEWAIDAVAGDPWFYADESIMAVNDETLFGAYSEWSYAEPDTPEELASFWEFQWRLSHLILAPLVDMELLLDDLAETASST